MKRYHMFLVFMLASMLSYAAQPIRLINQEQYLAQIKLVDEFMERFNNPTTPYLLLVDGERYLNDSLFQHQCHQMIDTLESNPVTLSYAESGWYANIHCAANTFNGHDTLQLTLSVEPRGIDTYKWVIADVQGDLFNSWNETNNDIYIMPNQHEMDFMDLTGIINEAGSNIFSLAKTNAIPNRLSIFETLVYTQQLRLETITDLSFTFLQVPGFRFIIRYFPRESKNSGWLISEICPTSDDEKKQLLKIIH